jgi:hypothetical protein
MAVPTTREITFCKKLFFSLFSFCSIAKFIYEMDKTSLLYIVKSYF